MPIVGLTDRTPSFKEIGRLRLGIPKKEALQSGPKEIAYFRPDFRPDAMSAAQDFTQIYGATPTEIHFRLPFNEINRCWDAFYMVYNKTGLLGMSDGERWLYLRHNQTGALIVKDGIPTSFDGSALDANGMPYMPFDKNKPVYSYKNKNGQDVGVYAKPEGRLKILIPELKRAAFVTVITHSIYNCIKISEQLAGIKQVAETAGMNLPMIPMVLSRRKEAISVSINGQKAMQEKYLLNVEIDPAWMEAQFRFLDTILPGIAPKLAAPTPIILPELPAPHEVNEDDEQEQNNGEQWPNEEDQDWQAGEPDITVDLKYLAGIVDSNGNAYLMLPSSDLSNKSIGIGKALAKNGLTAEQRAEYETKLAAIKEILDWRASHPAA